MKINGNKIVNLLMGVLLLITISYSIPSIPRQRNITQTEWVKTVKHNEISASSKSFQPHSFAAVVYTYRILSLKNRLHVIFKLNELFQLAHNPIKFAPAKTFFNDDDYLLS
ncbi:MAG TPA: hypothetical protein VGQ59_00620 [Cyclobacteriaceae bacterium]|jgi:hypothetical protein|nr:hypothetical protein [Cyclobacteriaceae bacterium]